MRAITLHRLAADSSARAGAFVLGVLVAGSAAVVLFSPYDADGVDFAVSREGPSLAHPLGTDQFGRDVATRLADGGLTTLAIAAGALALILGVGIAYGTASALAGGLVDAALMRMLDGLLALPRLPISIVILVVLGFSGQTIWAVVLALGVVNWMLTARLVRGEVRAIRARQYVAAARALGASGVHVARRHLVPNSLGIVVVAVLLELPAVILGEAFLSVLGLGPAPPTATWGNIAREAMHFSRTWLVLLPTVAIAGLAVGATLLADGLQAALDPRRDRRGA